MEELEDKWESVKQSLDKYYLGTGAGESGHIYLLKHANGKKVAIREATIFKLAAGEEPILIQNEDNIWLLSDEFHNYEEPNDWGDDLEKWRLVTDAEKWFEEYRQHMKGKMAWLRQAGKDVEAGLIPYLVQNESGEWEMRQMARAEPTENNLL